MIKTYIDSNVISKMLSDKGGEPPFLESSEEAYQLEWSSLLTYLGQGAIFKDLSSFDLENPLFASIIALLHASDNAEVVVHAFDRIFVEFLTRVKALPQVQAHFLLKQIYEKQETKQTLLDRLFVAPLHHYKIRLETDTSDTLHDLILYLAWDRVCVFFSAVFDYQTKNECFLRGLLVLKGCLVESFQHITKQGRTKPGFFRLSEALYAFDMRDERIQCYTDAEWESLCASSQALRPTENLSSVCYIDQALVIQEGENSAISTQPIARSYTTDSEAKVQASYSLAHRAIQSIMKQDINRNYFFAPIDTIYLDA